MGQHLLLDVDGNRLAILGVVAFMFAGQTRIAAIARLQVGRREPVRNGEQPPDVAAESSQGPAELIPFAVIPGEAQHVDLARHPVRPDC